MNHFGAEMKIRVGIDNVRRVWRVEYQPGKRDRVSGKVQVLSESVSGRNLWDQSNCHLEETSLKAHFAHTQKEKEYLLRIRNPASPFHAEAEEEVKYSVERGCLTIGEVETPRTAFHFIKRSHRAAKGPRS